MIIHCVGPSFQSRWPLTILSVTAGAFGACIQLPTVFAEAVGNRRLFLSHIAWLLLTPVIGAAGGAFYLQSMEAVSGVGRTGRAVEAFVQDAPSVTLGEESAAYERVLPDQHSLTWVSSTNPRAASRPPRCRVS